MKTLAIVSSYNILCGNATYAEALRKEFSKFYNVTMLPLDVNLLSNKYDNIENSVSTNLKHKIVFETIESITTEYRMRRSPVLVVKGKFDRFMLSRLICEMLAEYSIEEINAALIRDTDHQIVETKPIK